MSLHFWYSTFICNQSPDEISVKTTPVISVNVRIFRVTRKIGLVSATRYSISSLMHNTSNPRDDAAFSRSTSTLHTLGGMDVTFSIRLLSRRRSGVSVRSSCNVPVPSGCSDNLRANKKRRARGRSRRFPIAVQLSPLLLATSLHNPRQFVPHRRRSFDFYCQLRINKALSIRPRFFRAAFTRWDRFSLFALASFNFTNETRVTRVLLKRCAELYREDKWSYRLFEHGEK